MKIILKDDRCFSELAQDSVFVKAWNSFRILKDSCCQCNDNISPVCADFTWGNFWYLGTIDKFEVPQEEYTDGSSMLLVHSMKAEGLLNQWRSTISIHPRTYKEACIGHLMFQSQLNRHIIYKRYIYSKSREYFQKKWRTESYQQLKKEFFSISNNQSFELAAKLDIKFKAYIWYIIYNIQRMINKLYEIFKKQ